MTPWLSQEAADIGEFMTLCRTKTRALDYPLASHIERGVVIYEASTIPGTRDERRRDLMAEIRWALAEGPGVVVFADAFADHRIVNRATEHFTEMIAHERAAGTPEGDHFGKAGDNSRLWNSLEKLGRRDPSTFIDYYSNDAVAVAAESWLGPGYQVTSQVNVVNPGGRAQVPHRDYHLGFQPVDALERYPAHVHLMTPQLTLQGAVAHGEMPLVSGPTMLLPHSQKFAAGYLIGGRPDFQEVIADSMIQLPLAQGDVVFFNPAVIHGAGSNDSVDIVRMANLLQVSSAFGRPTESVDRTALSIAIYPELHARYWEKTMDEHLIGNSITSAADGYAFPTNLDQDQPIGGLAPPSQVELVQQGLREGWDTVRMSEVLWDYADRRRSAP